MSGANPVGHMQWVGQEIPMGISCSCSGAYLVIAESNERCSPALLCRELSGKRVVTDFVDIPVIDEVVGAVVPHVM